jgi:hypothetical protein
MQDKKLCIIVPYSDRKEQMYTFIGHMEYFLKDKVDYQIHFIEQKDADVYFNYGKLCNIGIDITANTADYYVFHDIDILPKQELCDYTYTHYPTHLATNLKPYANWIGGALKIRKEDIIKVNGFSNDYWGGVFHWEDLLFRLNKHKLLPVKRFFTKDVYKPHRLVDTGEIYKFSKKQVYPFISDQNNCAFIKANKKTDYLFEDSFTISMDIWINDNQSTNGCIIGKQGYDMGIFVMKNEAISIQIWGDDNSLHNIWFDHKNYTNQWINICVKADMDYKKLSLFIDGKLVTSSTLPELLMDFRGKDLWIGSMAFKDCFEGKISNLLCFDYALTESEIEKIYVDGYKTNETINTNFEAIIDITFNKKFGDFYVDESKSKAHARLICTGIHNQIYSEEITLSHETNMTEQSLGRFEVMDGEKKFSKLDVYNWDEKDGNFLENESIFFYEIANETLNTDNFGLNTLSYDLISTEEIKNDIFLHTINI